MFTTAKRKISSDIGNLIKAIAFWAIDVENFRQSVVDHTEFSLDMALDLLDPGKKNLIEKKNFHTFLGANKINCSHIECDEMMYQLFSFTQCVPVEVFIQFLQVPEKQEVPQNNKFTKQALVTIFDRFLYGHRQIQQLRQKLQMEDSFHLWTVVTGDRITPVLEESMGVEFMKSIGSSLNSDEWKALMIYGKCEFMTQQKFIELIKPVLPSEPSNFKKILQKKYEEYGIQPQESTNDQVIEQGKYNFRKVFDPIKEGRPEFEIDKNYLRQLRDYQERYIAPCRNYSLQYKGDQKGIRYHDQFFSDYYLYLHRKDQDELFFNRFGKRYVYEKE